MEGCRQGDLGGEGRGKKLLELRDWYADEEGRRYCRDCRRVKAREGKPPPCAECAYRRPELCEANEEAWALWQAVQTQWRAGGFGVVGLDYGEVERAARNLDIELDPCTWLKIRALERSVLSRQGKEGRKKDA